MQIGLIGYGKMGQEIERAALKNGHTIGFIVDKDNSYDLNKNNLSKVDVVMEFTTPESAFDNIQKCLEEKTPVVSGTTGWLNDFKKAVEICNRTDGAFLYSSNFSPGVNILFHISDILANIMNRFDQYNVEINEIHHTSKKDAPSGTAISLAENLIKNIKRKTKWVNKTSADSEKISIISKRENLVPGTHILRYSSDIDSLEINHVAKSRTGFAAGALIAAEFLITRKGVYDMNDVMGI